VQLALQAQHKRPADLVMDLVKAFEPGETTPDEARRKVQERVKQAAARVTPRPKRTKEERAQAHAQRQAAKEAEARRDAEYAQRRERSQRGRAFLGPLEALARLRETAIPEDPDTVLLRQERGLYTLAEMVACLEEVVDVEEEGEEVARVTELLQHAREASAAMEHAWQEYLQRQ
jgi:hypothetical protein